MAQEMYVGINGKARKIIKAYVGVNGVAREITAGYAGVGGVAKKVFSKDSGEQITLNPPDINITNDILTFYDYDERTEGFDIYLVDEQGEHDPVLLTHYSLTDGDGIDCHLAKVLNAADSEITIKPFVQASMPSDTTNLEPIADREYNINHRAEEDIILHNGQKLTQTNGISLQDYGMAAGNAVISSQYYNLYHGNTHNNGNNTNDTAGTGFCEVYRGG